MDEDVDGFGSYLSDLLQQGYVDETSPAGGITRQVIDRGVGSLTEKQKYVFDKQVMGDYGPAVCKRCQTPIPWSERLQSLDNGGLCNYCEHMAAKDD